MTHTKDKTIYDMCMTMRHDFGLDKPQGGQYSAQVASGVTPEERAALIRSMDGIYRHHIQPILVELEKARETGAEFASLAERRRGFEEAYKTACSVRNRLIQENHALQKDAERGRLLRLLNGNRRNEVADSNIELRADVRRLKLLVGEPVTPTWEAFVGPRQEGISARIRRKIAELKGDQS